MNFARDVVDAAPPGRRALVVLPLEGERHEISFGEVADRSARLAGTLVSLGVRQGDVLMTVIGNRPDWVYAMVACFRIGAVALPCTEQLRAKDLGLRLAVARPTLVLADGRNEQVLRESGWSGPTIWVPGVGDWGVGGLEASIGKLAIYTAAGGIDPRRVIPVMLDVGTDRESLLNDAASHQDFGARGREIAITRFTTDEIIPQYEALYQKMVTRRK